MKYRAIQEQDRRYPIRLMCRALAVSPDGYYAWRVRPESQRSRQNRTLRATIRVLRRASRETYGNPRIWDGELALLGGPAGSVLAPSGWLGHGAAINR
nr:hypothetical protein [Nitrosomonas nitrosa]